MKKNPDCDFTITGIRRSTRSQAMRRAVLSPLFGRQWLSSDNAEDNERSIIEAMRHLRNVWHARLNDFRKVGWAPALNAGTFATMWNCPPFGVFTSSKYMFQCNRRMVCPFCYARAYVLKPFMLFEDILYAKHEATTKPNTEGWMLISFLVVDSVMDTNEKKRKDDLNIDVINKLCSVLRKTDMANHALRKVAFVKSKATYGVVQWRIDPLVTMLKWYRGGMMLTKNLIDVEKFKHHSSDYVLLEKLFEITEIKETLARACAKVFAYPRGLLFNDAEATVAVLDSFKCSRLFSSYGF